jgi:hypothetical protein
MDIRGLGAPINLDVVNANGRFDVLTLNRLVDIPAGGSVDVSVRNDDNFFIIEAMMGTVYSNAPSAGVAGTPFADQADPTIANNTNAFRHLISVELKTQNTNWTRGGVPLNHLFGDGVNPHYPVRQPMLAPGETLFAKFTNNSAQSCRVLLSFEGTTTPRVA